MKQRRVYASLRAWRGMRSQGAAAEQLGLSQGLYCKYELRRVSPRPQRAMAISAQTGVPFEILMRVA